MQLKSECQQSIDEFMRLGRQDVPDRIIIPSKEVRHLRAKLILEEALETIHALGFFVRDNFKSLMSDHPVDIDGVIDGCADLHYVTIGCLSAFGVPDLPVLATVAASNLTKFSQGCSIRDDGKVIKSPNFVPPDYEKALGINYNDVLAL